MNKEGKYLWTVKVSEKGQIAIPKQAREVFDIKTGDTLILLGDITRGIAIAKYEDYLRFAEEIFKATTEEKND
jgi:AbrB family looped-hinge helix DNA binding protein